MLELTVSQLNRYVKSLLEENNNLRDVYIRGEISNFKNHFRSGHLYFTLKDEKASVRCVMFAGYAKSLKFEPEDSMEVLARASVSLYEVSGEYQLYVTDIQPDGVGAAEIALRQLQGKLDKKGYFLAEYKKSLPDFPQIIGVITSKTGAAIEDIKQVISNRYPAVTIRFFPALVQGDQAPGSLVAGIKALDNRCDVIIIGRGGGSKEDLYAFNSEILADAIFSAFTPIVSAVGHEIDTTICDLVADQRAATPSAAAEMVVPSKRELQQRLDKAAVQIGSLGRQRIKSLRQRLEGIENQQALRSPGFLLEKKQKELDFIFKEMYNIQRYYFDTQRALLKTKAGVLESLSPFGVLARGYSVLAKDESPIKSIQELTVGDSITLQLNDGIAEATIDGLHPKGLKQ